MGHREFEKKTFGPLIEVETELADNEKEIILSYFRKLKDIIKK